MPKQRVNVMLPDETIIRLNKVVKKGDRSNLIDVAVNRYLDEVGRDNLRERLKEGAIRRVDHDRQIVEEWFPLDEEVWQKSKA